MQTQGVNLPRLDIGIKYIAAKGNTAGIIMLDNHGCRLIKLTEQCNTCIHIKVIIIRHLLSLNRFHTGDYRYYHILRLPGADFRHTSVSAMIVLNGERFGKWCVNTVQIIADRFTS